MDCSLPGSSAHGIFQARVLEWGAIAFSRKGALLGFKIVLIFLLICFFYYSQWLSLAAILERVINKLGEGNGTPLQYCCPENPMDGGAW